jgi:hypothetical protein
LKGVIVVVVVVGLLDPVLVVEDVVSFDDWIGWDWVWVLSLFCVVEPVDAVVVVAAEVDVAFVEDLLLLFPDDVELPDCIVVVDC